MTEIILDWLMRTFGEMYPLAIFVMAILAGAIFIWMGEFLSDLTKEGQN